ncbi:kinase-like protein [Fomitiporia mediterranea MF3/22]|uniref:kinase-like protein n=1 Tax=Fomitiporia mediterranea (strain MF3/22) TaxID=694068 RepID=UPI0004408441|nr:kinase-like protein [Fomitiporia mediterranea MF3/22]EJD05033.1 kinase-like protein [Fomitiporia mediterranea MF3/22]
MAWSRLKHPNVLPLLGYALEETSDHVLQLPSLISEWMENGNILDFVKSNPNFDIVRLALGMAEGLAYLHDNNVVHSDFKSGNVLISSTGEPVISDFGAAHVAFDLLSGGKSSTVTDLRGTSRWLAYELLANADQYPAATKESDTWAFGMTLCELLTNAHPYAQYQYDVQVTLAIMNRKLPSPPEDTGDGYKRQLWDVCTDCWDCDPAQRPSMADVSCRIKNIPIPANAEISRIRQSQTDSDSHRVSKDVAELLRTEFPQLELSGRLDIRHEEDPCRVDAFARYFNGFLGSQRIIVKKFRVLPSIVCMLNYTRILEYNNNLIFKYAVEFIV